MPLTASLKILSVLAIGIAGLVMVACEGVTLPTEQPVQPSPTTSRDTAVPTIGAGSVATQTAVTPVAGGRPTVAAPTVVPTGVAPAPTQPGTAGSAPVRAPSQAAIDILEVSRFEGGLVVGVDGVELGVIRPVSQVIDSICDNPLAGGAAFGEPSIFNDQSPYGGPFGANSPFNTESAAPPAVMLDGVLAGHLTVSPLIIDPIDPFLLLDWLGCPVDSVSISRLR